MADEDRADSVRPIVILSARLGPIGEEERRIDAAGGTVRSEALWSLEDIRERGADAAVFILGAVEPFDAAALESIPRCIAVVRRGVGYDNVDVDAATRAGILVANVPDASVEEVSDHALALLIGIERRIVGLDRAVHAGEWQRDPAGIAAVRTGIRRLCELTLGIIGFGRIGRALARKARPVYGRVVVADPIAPAEAATELGAVLLPLDDVLAAADHLSLHAPLDPGTRHLIDGSALGRMRAGAVLVNTSRGGLVDETALVQALHAGSLRAGLDVTEHEPFEAGDPLLDAPGLVLTAHSAMASLTASAELEQRSVDATVAILGGRRPASIVNPEVLGAPNLRATALADR
jgi:phosphoglycerate dehydrogenase-like enzyme